MLKMENSTICFLIRLYDNNGKRSVFFPNGEYLASPYFSKIILWRVSSGESINTSIQHSWLVISVVFSPNSEYSTTISGDYTIDMLEISTGKHIRTFSGHSFSVFSVNFSPNG